MKRSVIDQARAEWKDAVDAIASRPYYRDQDRADRFFYEVVVPIWRHAIGLGDMAPKQVMQALHISPTMRLMLFFFGACVLGKGGPNEKRAPRLKSVWPPYVSNGRMVFLRAVPKSDIAKIIGKTPGAVTHAIAGLRGSKGKTGSVLFDKRLVYPAPQATGIMMDGAFDMQLSLPFVYNSYVYARDDYETLAEVAMVQRIQAGATWTQAREWAGNAREVKFGTKSLRDALRRDDEDNAAPVAAAE